MTSDRRRYIRVTVDMARNPKLLALQPAHRWLYLEALCHCGEYLTDGRLTPSAMASLGGSLGVSLARNNAWRALERAGLIEPLGDESGYRIRDYLDHQESRDQVEQLRAKRQQAGSKGGAAKANAVASARAVAKQKLQQTPSYVDVDVKKELTTSPPPAPRPEVRELCEHLHSKITENGSKASITQKWLDSARLMIDRDGRDPEEAHRLIDWCQADDFWHKNILSMPTFREQYDRLRLKASSTNGHGNPRAAVSARQHTFADGTPMPWDR